MAKGQVSSLGSLVRRAREAIGISQAELSRRTKMSTAQVSRLEAEVGSFDPHLSTLVRLRDVLGLSLEEMAQTQESDVAPKLLDIVAHLTDSISQLRQEVAGQAQDLRRLTDLTGRLESRIAEKSPPTKKEKVA